MVVTLRGRGIVVLGAVSEISADAALFFFGGGLAWTEDDLTAVEEAIRARLLTDQSKKSISQFVTGDRMERYRDVPLPDLMKLRDEIKEELKLAAGTPRQRVFVGRTNKGL